jgi:3-hydroxyisobutyrate dehydrogenase-like beta-hydroxyacid dehydrogenase
MKSVAILGVGKMGSAMAKELATAGYQVTLWNRNQSVADKLASEINLPTVTVSVTPKSALENVDIALCLFTNGIVTQSVLLDDTQVLEGVRSNLIIVDMGTSGVESAKALASALASKKIAFIDAPVSGSVVTIAAHQLLVMASGDKAVIEQATPVFSVFAKKTAYLGQAGAGQAMKLAVNLIVHTLNAAVSEGLALATASSAVMHNSFVSRRETRDEILQLSLPFGLLSPEDLEYYKFIDHFFKKCFTINLHTIFI